MKEKYCLVCGKKFLTYKKTRKFCSLSCFATYNNSNNEKLKKSFSEAKRGRTWKDISPTKWEQRLTGNIAYCDNCINIIGYLKKSRVLRSNNHFCSLSCKAKHEWNSRNPEQKSEFLALSARSGNRKTKPEKILGEILTRNFGDTWIYSGNGSSHIGKYHPDFICGNKVIEVYGDYWHKGQDPNDRINLFKEYGYDTLVIWEHEIYEEKESILIDKVNRLMNQQAKFEILLNPNKIEL